MVCVRHSRLQEAEGGARGDGEGLPWGPPENQTSWAADGQSPCSPRGWRSPFSARVWPGEHRRWSHSTCWDCAGPGTS